MNKSSAELRILAGIITGTLNRLWLAEALAKAGNGSNYSSVDRIIRKLRQIYKENPALFDIPAFAQK